MPFIKVSLPKVLLVALLAAVMITVSALSNTSETPKNVIIFIGDGMDDHQISIARNYLKGASGRLALDDLSVRGSVQVLTVDESKPQQPIYVADSASSATAIATGQVTSRGRIATSAKTDVDLRTIVELAEAENLRTGIVTTASITDATPASFVAHVSNRGCEGPQLMSAGKSFGGLFDGCDNDRKSNGGPGSIAVQLAASAVDIYLGGGREFFQQPTDEVKTSLELAQLNRYQIIQNRDELSHLTSDKVMGLFSETTMPVRLMGEGDQSAEFLKIRDEVQVEPKAFACVSNPQAENVPTLKAMTTVAIDHLSRNNDRGFFLMVESASIDKQSHLRRPCGSIGELDQLDEAVQVALAFAKKSPETLILVTADHGQAAQLVPYPSLFDGMSKAYSIGHLAVIKTPEGSLMGVNYATNDALIEEHTGTQVPLLMNKPVGSPTKGMITQPQLFEVMRSYLEL